MEEKKKDKTDALQEAYEADKERRSVREDELQAAQDYLGVLLKEIETKNKELDDKRKEAENLMDALKKSEVEKQEEVNATNEARESGRYKSIWIGIAIIEFLAIIAVLISLFIVYGKVKSDYEEKIIEIKKENENQNIETTPIAEPEPETVKLVENLGQLAGKISSQLKDGFSCGPENIDGLEYLVFSKGDLKVCYKNESIRGDKNFRKAVIIEKGDRRIYENLEYDFEKDMATLCPQICRINENELLLISDYAGFGNMPDIFRLFDVKNLSEYYGDDINEKISSLMQVSFLDSPSGIQEAPIQLELATSKATYKYGLSEAGYNEIGYAGVTTESRNIADLTSEFRIEIGEEGISWKTVVKLGRRFYLGELRGEITLGAGSVVISNAKFGAFVSPNVEDPELNGLILPAESIPEKYVTISGLNSERYYISINDKVKLCGYDWERLNSQDPNNWVYFDENGDQLSVRGIDVSKYQDVIDWQEVAKAGVEFAIIRLGYRGMNEGTLEMDPFFEANIKGAEEAGIKIGVYFFSQAITKKEAAEEADFVIEALKDYNITYPVVFDTERVATFNARANGLSYNTRTEMCITFCDKMEKAGYNPCIYANTKYMIMGIDLERLEKYDKWFACYSSDITFPYDFQMLQYSDSGTIPGIKGNVDLNISFVDYSKSDEKNG